jgi:hypothetical protein
MLRKRRKSPKRKQLRRFKASLNFDKISEIMGRYAIEPDNATKSAKARGSNLR